MIAYVNIYERSPLERWSKCRYVGIIESYGEEDFRSPCFTRWGAKLALRRAKKVYEKEAAHRGESLEWRYDASLS